MKRISFIFLFLFYTHLQAATWTVTNTNNSGSGSLAWAISQSQTHIGTDLIKFNIPKSDPNFDGSVWKIYLTTALDNISDSETIIDGSSQQSNQGDTNPKGPEVEIHGENIGTKSSCLQIMSAGNNIRDLAIGGFSSSGIIIKNASAKNNIITGCYVGIDAKGQTAIPNGENGIQLSNYSENTTVGGTRESDKNIVSGNAHYGINIENSSDNSLLGNYVGVAGDGKTAIPNGGSPKQFAGVFVSYKSARNRIGNGATGGRNVISGNFRTGIRIEYVGADSNIVQGNYIGVGRDGQTAVANGEVGVLVGRGAKYNLIGGDNSDQGNIISGNHSSAVQFAREASENVIKGNYIGLDGSGQHVVSNDHNGIYLYGDDSNGFPHHNTIGPNNVICGNGVNPARQEWAGIRLEYAGTAFNQVIGNYIGADHSGTIEDGQPTGVLIMNGAHDNTVGPNNVIANNDYNGVQVQHATSIHNKITQNKIYGNGRQAIENVNNGNLDIHAPQFSRTSPNDIRGNTYANALVEFYKEQSGQAAYWMKTVTANGSGAFSWTNGNVNTGFIALCIDSDGNTSEFSQTVSLPVELISFEANAVNQNDVLISWRTGSEANNLGFELLRKKGSGEFQKLTFVAGQGTTQQENNYSYLDKNLGQGEYIYRLDQIDTDGTISSTTTRIKNHPQEFDLTAFPNPFNSSTSINFNVVESAQFEIRIFNNLGQVVRVLEKKFYELGSHQITWNGLDDLGNSVPSGIYFCQTAGKDFSKTVQLLLLR